MLAYTYLEQGQFALCEKPKPQNYVSLYLFGARSICLV